MPARLSESRLAVVSVASVVSASISLPEPTNVVFPTPKPPAIRILICRGNSASEVSETSKQCLQDFRVVGVGVGGGRAGDHRAHVDQVRQQDLRDVRRLVQVCGDLGNGDRHVAQAQRLRVLVTEPVQRDPPSAGRLHQRHEVEDGARLGAPVGRRVGPDPQVVARHVIVWLILVAPSHAQCDPLPTAELCCWRVGVARNAGTWWHSLVISKLSTRASTSREATTASRLPRLAEVTNRMVWSSSVATWRTPSVSPFPKFFPTCWASDSIPQERAASVSAPSWLSPCEYLAIPSTDNSTALWAPGTASTRRRSSQVRSSAMSLFLLQCCARSLVVAARCCHPSVR